jgi:hypothetical protein
MCYSNVLHFLIIHMQKRNIFLITIPLIWILKIMEKKPRHLLFLSNVDIGKVYFPIQGIVFGEECYKYS